MAKTTKTSYGGAVTRSGTTVTARFDVTDDDIEDTFAWFFHALEDAYAAKERGTVGDQIMENMFKQRYGRQPTPRDDVLFTLVGAISLFLADGINDPYETKSGKDILAGRIRDFINELSGFEEDLLHMPRGSLKT